VICTVRSRRIQFRAIIKQCQVVTYVMYILVYNFITKDII